MKCALPITPRLTIDSSIAARIPCRAGFGTTVRFASGTDTAGYATAVISRGASCSKSTAGSASKEESTAAATELLIVGTTIGGIIAMSGVHTDTRQ